MTTKRYAIITLVIGMLIISILGYDFREQIYQKSINIRDNYNFSIQLGDSFERILLNMYDEELLKPYQGVVPLSWYTRLYVRLNGTRLEQIQAGEYLLEPDMKFHQFLDKAFAGEVVQRKLAIIEGYTMKQVLDAMKATPYINVSSTDYANISLALGISQSSPEGWIFPDTYYYTVGIDSIDLLKRGYQKMQTILSASWQTRDPNLPLTSPYQALILASIVEKETTKIEERPRVAGVFISRLKKNMLLQADPTIIYGLGDRFDGNLRSKDLKEDQPYNSYTRKGLPPTPIAMPSLSSIIAVMNPEYSDYLYFVAKGDGGHHFSKTYAEHLKAVRKYQLKR